MTDSITEPEVVGIRVGVQADYGAVQVTYVKRGCLPDGRGIQYDGLQLQFTA